MSENEYRDAGDQDLGGEGGGGATEEFSRPEPDLSAMSPRERRNFQREQRKRRQEAAKARRKAIREEGRRRRAGLPAAAQDAAETPDDGSISDEQPAAETNGASAAGDGSAAEPINTDDFADVDESGPAPAPVDPVDPANLSRKERRELRKRRREELREAAKLERRRALADDRGDEDEAASGDDDEGAGEEAPVVAIEAEGTDAAPEAAVETPAEQENDVAETTSEGIGEPQLPIETEAPAVRSAEDRIKAAEAREEDALIEASEQDANAKADRRVREVQQIQRVAEHNAAEPKPISSPAWSPGSERDAGGHPVTPFTDELRATEEHIRRRRQRDQELIEELDATEVRIGETRERTQEAIEEAQRRLEEIQAQAAEAEERAARAEQIAEYKQAEAEREHHLLEMLEKINDAERRAREAEAKARRAVADVARPFEALKAPDPLPPDAPASIEDLKSRPFDPDASDAESGAEGAEPHAGGPLNINEASFEQLRAIGMSVTQVGRLLAVRERSGGFTSVEELDSIPGFPRDFLDSVRERLTA